MTPSLGTSGRPAAAGVTRTAADVPTSGELTFRIDVGHRSIGRFAECSGLAVEYEVTEYVEGGNNEFVHKLRGGVRYPNVTLRRGITHEAGLIEWFYETLAPARRPTVTITIVDGLGATVRQFALGGALPVRWTGPSVTAESSKAASESLEIAHRGFV